MCRASINIWGLLRSRNTIDKLIDECLSETNNSGNKIRKYRSNTLSDLRTINNKYNRNKYFSFQN